MPVVRLLPFAILLPLSTHAFAFDDAFRSEFPYQPNEWQTAGMEGVRNVSRKVTDAMWSQRTSLWLEVKNDGTDWEQAGPSFCVTLNGAGKPENAFVIISFWRRDEIVTKVTCD